MTALTGLIDALLAARLAPRLDVLGIKPEAAIGKPGPVVDVEKAANDVRLPSHAALDREIPGAATGLPLRAGSGHAPASIAMHMSQAARVIGAVLADLQAEPGPVRGAQPAVPTPTAGAAQATALAGGLAQTVAGSGLFYESHLAQLATGSRTLAQMSGEPQARWSVLPASMATAAQTPAAATLPAVDALTVAGAAAAAADGEAGAAQALPRAVADATQPAAAAAAARPAGAEASPASAATPSAAATPASEAATHVETARLQAAYGWADPAAPAAPSLPARHAEEAAVRHTAAATAPAGEVIHPQAVTLVHQQLDLLATSVFRWNGEAWPGVPMRWQIEEEKNEPEHEAGAPDADAPRRWSTRVSLELPRLGVVELRLGIAGAGVHAHLAAGEAATLALLRADSGRLASRFEAAGLRLQELQLGAEVAA